MNIAQKRMTIIFNEWAARYADCPAAFSKILDDAGRPISDYGQNCAYYFEKIAHELEELGKLPRLEKS